MPHFSAADRCIQHFFTPSSQIGSCEIRCVDVYYFQTPGIPSGNYHLGKEYSMKSDTKRFLKIGLMLFLLYLAIHYWSAIASVGAMILSAGFPLILGCAIAYILGILMGWYERHYFPHSRKPVVRKTRRIVSLILAITSLLLIVGLVCWLILPQLTDCTMLLLNEVPKALDKLLAYVYTLDILPEDIYALLDAIDWKSSIDKIAGTLTSGVGSVMDVVIGTVSSVFSGVVTAVLAIIFALYLLISKESLGHQFHRICRRYLRPSFQEKLFHVLDTLNDCFHKFIVGQCLEAVILGLLCTLGMMIFQFPYATMIGALIAFTALIPIAGAYIGAFVGAFMILTVSPMKALLFLVYILVLQQLEGNIVYPKVVGSSIGLPGIWVLAAVTVGGGVMGVVGMLLGVPLAATIYRLVGEDVAKADPPVLSDGEDAEGFPTENEPEETAVPPETEDPDTADTESVCAENPEPETPSEGDSAPEDAENPL